MKRLSHETTFFGALGVVHNRTHADILLVAIYIEYIGEVHA